MDIDCYRVTYRIADWERIARENGECCAPIGAVRAVNALCDEVERLRVGHDRYETARRMNPQQWKAAWELHLKTGKPFDEIIDDMRLFMAPNKEVSRGAPAPAKTNDA